jgi:hypothetical protein
MAKAYYLTHRQSDPVKAAQWRVDECGLFHDDSDQSRGR